ncbi:phage portal protein family protein [Flavobacterium cerinum]|uniref:DUF935 family protein n=1 Tax=Flavobacterium cerinum TaxID=2502784 RepID=A0A444GM95_9FLAO|nr:DUF935 family protein [Flavobacterium cerinum]RWW91851.1 DUF935 family protein [Flavobacterium cerinum]
MNIFGFNISRNTANVNNKVASTSSARDRVNDNDKKIIDQIVKQYTDRSRKDIDKWRSGEALAMHPEKPRYYQLQDVFNDLKKDGHFKAQVRLRKYATLNTKFTVNSEDGQTNDEATKFLNNAWFYSFLSKSLDAIIFGPTLLEFLSFDAKRAKFQMIPRRNVVPDMQAIYPDVTKDDYIDYNDPYYDNWLIEVKDDETEFGLINDIIPNLIWKRNVSQSWAEFCEKFGLPLITATTNSTDPKVIDKVDYMLQQLGEASTAVFPVGTTIEFKEANRTDAYQVYNEFIKMNKTEISTAIVGGNMITENGSSKSQSEVHERNLDDKIAEADKRFIKFLVTDQLLPLLIAQGYGFFKETDTLEFDQSHSLELDKFWPIVKGIIESGYEPEIDWISKTFSIPLVGKKKVSIEPVAKYESISGKLNLPHYPDACCEGVVAVSKGFENRLKDYHDKLIQEVWDNKDTLSTEAQLIANEGLEFLKGLQDGWGKQRIKAAWNAPDHLALSMMEYNLFEFAESKTEARLATLSDLLINKDKAQIRSFAEFKQEALKQTDNFNTTWLETEYNLSVATGQTSAAYLRFMAEKDNITSFVQYQTAGDNRVRPEHASLNGKIFSLDDKEAMKLWPPNSYNCRCEMVQYIGKTDGRITSGKDAKKALGEKFDGSKFDLNRGDLKEVFTKAQMYAKEEGKTIEKMTFDKAYDLEPYKQMKSLSKAPIDNTITPENAKELFKESAPGLMAFEDYLKRKMVMTKKNFNTHTQGKYVAPGEDRHKIFPLVKNALLSPDEVWLKPKTKQTFYLSFFEDFVLAVPVNVGKQHNEVGTWFKMKVDEGVIRSGVLIHKKKL